MNIEEVLKQYPMRRIKSADGMAVTAAVWEEAHEYHRQIQGLHTLFSHGVGILSGLEVIASDPPDTSLYILPGVAIDQNGQSIILSQPVAYDLGYDMDGLLYLVLSYDESQPKSDNGSQEGDPLFIHGEFSISAQAVLADTPGVELARVRRSKRESILLNAPNPIRPGADEIDLRFRREVGAPQDVSIAISYLGEVSDKKHGRGAAHLAQAINHGGNYRVTIEDNVAIGPGIVTNTLIYLVGQGSFELSDGVMNGLRNYVSRGKGTLFIESMDEAAEKSFLKFLTAKSMKPSTLEAGHRLLSQPYLFAAPPAGFETQEKPKITISEGVIFSTNNYGFLWQGERQGRMASREEIRSATEWGENIITYAVNRQRG